MNDYPCLVKWLSMGGSSFRSPAGSTRQIQGQQMERAGSPRTQHKCSCSRRWIINWRGEKASFKFFFQPFPTISPRFSRLIDSLVMCALFASACLSGLPILNPLFSFLQRKKVRWMSWVRYWNSMSQGCCTISRGSLAIRLSEAAPVRSALYCTRTISHAPISIYFTFILSTRRTTIEDRILYCF